MSTERFQLLVDDTFHQIESRLNGAAAGPLHAVRRKALEAFQTQGVPTTRHEEWKYTNILPALAHEYHIVRRSNDAPIKTSVALHEMKAHDAPVTDPSRLAMDAYRLLIVNGSIQERASALPDDNSVEVQLITDAYASEHPEVATWLQALTPLGTHPFVAANAAMTDAGVLIRIRAGVQLERPLYVSVINDSTTMDVVATPHILVVVEPNAVCTIVEEHRSVGRYASLTSAVTQIVAEHDCKATYVKIIDDAPNAEADASAERATSTGDATHIGHTAGIVHANALLTCVTLCLGGKLTRNELEIKLAESSAETRLYGLSVLTGNELADNHTLVDHLAPRCHSEEEYKGVYDGRSTGVFNGKIMVRPDAQKTTAYQSNRTVLLSPSAQINAKPQLEIFADDVKCSHGATCGQIDEEAVFYLQSRGIGYAEARALIVYAFAAAIVEHIPHDDLQSILDRRIAEKLGAHPFDL